MLSVARPLAASRRDSPFDGSALARVLAALPIVVFAAACLLAVLFAGSGLGDEGRAAAGGDAPRYLMNGVYFMDLLHDRPFGSPDEFIEYTRYYYARYPALSLGHHPVLLSALTVPVFAVAGISLSAGRVVVIGFFLAAVVFTWALVRRTHGDWSAAAAAVLVGTNPYLLGLGQLVLSEIPGTSLLLAAAFFLVRFCDLERPRDLWCLVLLVALALYAKHLAAFALPGFALYALLRLGWRRLLRRDIVSAAIVFALLVAPLVPVTLVMAKANVSFVRNQIAGGRSAHSVGWLAGRTAAVQYAVVHQFSAPVLAAIGLGLLAAALRRDRGALLYVLWVGSVLSCVLVLTGTLEPLRYSMYWMPPLLALAAGLAATGGRDRAAPVLAVALAAIVVHQVWLGAHAVAPTTSGYEDAARFVVRQPHSPTIMFSGEIDSGLFVFFVRKHDPNRTQVVLRADKILATSFMGHAAIEERIDSPDEIPGLLKHFGTRYLVVEERATPVRVLNWVQNLVRTDAFRELHRTPLVSDDPRLPVAWLGVYEYRFAADPAPDAVLDIKLPIAATRIAVPLDELRDRRFLR
jgi:hypothetical protein